MAVPGQHADVALDDRILQGHADRAELLHLVDAQRRHGADAQAAGDHAAHGGQLMALEGRRQHQPAPLQGLLEQPAHHGGALQGDEVAGHQGRPVEARATGQARFGRHHGDEAVAEQRGEGQAAAGLGLEGDAQLHLAVAHHLDHLLVDHVVHRDVDARVAAAEGHQRRRQQVAGEGGHGGDRQATQLQGEALAQQLLGVVPLGDQPLGQGHQRLPLGGKAHAAGAAGQQAAAEALLEPLDGQAQRRLGEVQVFAGLGEAQGPGHGEEGTQLLDGHDGSRRPTTKVQLISRPDQTIRKTNLTNISRGTTLGDDPSPTRYPFRGMQSRDLHPQEHEAPYGRIRQAR